MTFAPGTFLGCYEIAAPLGSGGMGEVYRGRDTRLGRQVAIKVLAQRLAGDPKAQARFEREAKAVAALSHPNIRALFDYGESNGITYAVLELLEGETLGARLAAGPLPLRKALDFAVQIARGLTAAHERNIVHRDLKPENVFLTRDGQVKILDFGLALLTTPASEAETLVEGPAQARITESGVAMGTAGYMSPEQVRGLPADHRSDLFSFGAVLYEMLAGRRAFSGETPSDKMLAILQNEPPELPASVPRALDRIVRHCLEKRPEERFQSARDLAFDLEALTDLTIGTREAPPLAAGSRPQRARLLLASLLLVAAMTGAGLAHWRWRDPPSSPPVFRQLTFRRGTIHTARFAPDGETIVYGAAWEGDPLQIFTMRADLPESSPLPLPTADLLAVSRSGEIALSLGRYFLGSPFLSRGTLASTPLAGGAPREILDGVHQADWAPDGSSLAVVRLDALGRETRLEYPIGRVLQRSVSYIMEPRISPTGERVAVFELAGGSQLRLTVFDRAGRKEMSLPLEGIPFGLAWHPAGEEIWLSLLGSEGSRLQAVRLDGEIRLVSRTMGLTQLYDISPRGKVLLGNHLYWHGMAGRAPDETRERDLSWFQVSIVQDLSANGRTLLFDEVGASTGGARGIYLRPLAGSSQPMHLGPGGSRLLSPDGKWVLSGNANTLTLLPTGVGKPRPLQKHLLDTTGACSWFPDGRRILLSGRAPGDSAERLWVQDVAGGRPRAVTPPGIGFLGILIAVRPLSTDGRQVAALAPDGKLWIYSLEGDKPRAVPGLLPGDAFLRWNADGRSLFVWRRDAGSSAQVFRLDLATGTREPWLEVRPLDPAGIYTFTSLVLTPDGKSYAYDYGRMFSELYLVDGLR